MAVKKPRDSRGAVTVGELVATFEIAMAALPLTALVGLSATMRKFETIPLEANTKVRREVFFQRMNEAITALILNRRNEHERTKPSADTSDGDGQHSTRD